MSGDGTSRADDDAPGVNAHIFGTAATDARMRQAMCNAGVLVPAGTFREGEWVRAQPYLPLDEVGRASAAASIAGIGDQGILDRAAGRRDREHHHAGRG